MSFWTAGQCLFGHDDRVRERDAAGHLLLVCPRCGDVRQVLPGHSVGTPIKALKAKRVKRPKFRIARRA